MQKKIAIKRVLAQILICIMLFCQMSNVLAEGGILNDSHMNKGDFSQVSVATSTYGGGLQLTSPVTNQHQVNLPMNLYPNTTVDQSVYHVVSAINESNSKTVQLDVYGAPLPLNSNEMAGVSNDGTPPVTTMNIIGSSAGAGVYYGTVQIEFTAVDDLSGVQKTEYSLDGGANWSLYVGPVTLTVPKVYTIMYKSTDNSNNVENAKSQKITIKADTTPPTTAFSIISGTKGGGGFYTSLVVFQLIATDDSGIKLTEYSLDGGVNWVDYTGPVTLNNSSTVSYHSVDTNNNVEAIKTTKISIDTIAPLPPSIEFSPLTWTNGEVTVTLRDGFDDGSGALKSQYRFSTLDPWIDYTGVFVVTNNNMVYARTIDVAGNIGSEATKKPPIDRTPPTAPQIILSENNWTRNDVTVQIISGTDLESQVFKSEYKIGEAGVWSDYNAPFLISTEGETTIYARSIDFAGNISAESTNVVRIDRTAPSIPTIHASTLLWTNQDVSFTISDSTDTLSGVQKYQYKLSETAEWQDYSKAVMITSEGITTVYARAIDVAGNISDETTVNVQIDKTPPTSPTLIPSTTKWTREDVTFTIIDGEDALSGFLKSQYKIGANGVWTDYVDPFVITEEGLITVYARTLDVAGNASIEVQEFSKIDRTPPAAPAFLTSMGKSKDSITILWSASTDNVGVTAYNVYNGNELIGTTDKTTFTMYGMPLNGIQHFSVEALDEAGNVSVRSRVLDIMFSDTYISAFRSSFVIKNDNSVWGWGLNEFGQVGDGTTQNNILVPKPITAISSAKAVVSGAESSIILKNDGTVWALGNNTEGLLGNNSLPRSNTPVQVENLESIVSISEGLHHALALKSDGTVWGWGSNSLGELGDGTKNLHAEPIQIPGLDSIVAVSASYYHSMALKSDGTVWVWGGNGNGQLGIGNLVDQYAPVKVSSLTSIIGIAAGPTYSLALKEDGTVWYWGNDNIGFGYISEEDRGSKIPIQVPNLDSVIDISAGLQHVMVLKKNGTVWTWGNNRYGQLGDGNDVSTLSPVQVTHLTDVTSISANEASNLVTKGNSLVWAWGYNQNGILGDGKKVDQSTPERIQVLNNLVDSMAPDAPILETMGQTGTTVELTWTEASDNYAVIGYDVYMNDSYMGSTDVASKPSIQARTFIATNLEPLTAYNFYVKAKDESGNSSPKSNEIQVTTKDYVKPQISVGEKHSLALRSDGTVWSWGAYGQTGTATSEVAKVSDLESIINVQAGGTHSLALRSDGTVWAWGSNDTGQIGDGSTNNRSKPVKVLGLTSIIAIAVGNSHSLALQNDGTVWAWGENVTGQLGDGSTKASLVPKKINGLRDVTSVSAKGHASAAVKTDGTVWVWGNNGNSQLQPSSSVSYFVTPTQLPGLSSIKMVELGATQNGAIANDGSLYVWGIGYPGDGQSSKLMLPTKIASLTSVAWVSTSNLASDIMAIKNDGTVFAWGTNSNSKLGTGTNGAVLIPTQVPEIDSAVMSGLGNDFGVILKKDGTVWAVGNNSSNQLGTGNNTASNTIIKTKVPNLNPPDKEAPTQPTDLTVSAKSATTVDLKWQPSSDNIGVAGYDVYVGATKIGSTVNTSYTATNLNPVTTYTFSVKAFDEAGNYSVPSDSATVRTDSSISVVITSPIGTESAPSVINQSSPMIVWSQTNLGQTTVYSKYHILVLNDNNDIVVDSGEVAQNTSSTTASWKIPSSLPVEQRLHVQVQVFDGMFWSNWSQPQWFKVSTNYLQATLTSGGTTVPVILSSPRPLVTWSQTNGGQSTTFTSFEVQVLDANGQNIILDSGIQTQNTTSTTASYQIATDLPRGEKLQIRVKVGNDKYWSEWSNSTWIYVNSLPKVVVNVPNGTQSAPMILVGFNQTISWTQTDADANTTFTAFDLKVLDEAGNTIYNAANMPQNTSSNQMSWSLPGSVPWSQKIQVMVRVSDGLNWSEWSSPTWMYVDTPPYVEITSPLGSSNAPKVVAPTFTLTWKQTDVDANTVFTAAEILIRDYTSTQTLYNSGTIQQNTLSSTGSLTISPDLPRGQRYRVSMRVSDGYAWSEYAGDQFFIINSIPNASMTYPSGTSSSPSIVRTSKPTFSWTQTDAESSTIFSSYQVQVLNASGTVLVDSGILPQNTSASTYTWTSDTALPNGQNLQTKVRVYDGLEWSSWSNPAWFNINATITPMISSGDTNNILLKSNGTVWAWGTNGSGQLGDGTTTNRNSPVQVTGLSNTAVQVSANDNTSLALKNDGTVWGWGNNTYGQLGDGSTTSKSTPVQAQNMNSVNAVSTGQYHALALKSDGTVWAWGYNYYGQLGNGTTTNSKVPVQVASLTSIVAISAGDSHNLALKSDGTLWAWGMNTNGELGDGTTTNKSVPVQVLVGVNSISAGQSYSIIVKNDGTVWAFGINGSGQLGDGTTTKRTSPVQVANLSNIRAVSTSSTHSMALKNDGTVWTWGANSYGQLGDGTTTAKTSPIQVTGLNSVVAISNGQYFSEAIKSEGTVWSWGSNGSGQLGIGSTTSQKTPVQVPGFSVNN